MNTLGFIATKILMEKEGLPDDVVKKYSLMAAMMPKFDPIYLLLFQKIACCQGKDQPNRAGTVTANQADQSLLLPKQEFAIAEK